MVKPDGGMVQGRLVVPLTNVMQLGTQALLQLPTGSLLHKQ